MSIIIFGFFIVATCLLLSLVILIQNPKKESIHQSFMEKNFRFLGVKRTNTFLENVTWFLSIIIFFLILFFNFLLKSK
ncbi:preprotein translocase subunit SecG [Blattabacterium cuenoti]|uniref:preprotein translocase subunit SecG n=1 Tax=Blattabacterium cuenoti TaxID=1653831 RepID=UPI00293B8DC5|nr:preprotein translocase subunit SecG [Blattabacterium cuenoti]